MVKLKVLTGDELPEKFKTQGRELVFEVITPDGGVHYFESDEEAALAVAQLRQQANHPPCEKPPSPYSSAISRQGLDFNDE